MNRSIESVLRLVHLTSSGLLAGSLGFGDAALVPGWEAEIGHLERESRPAQPGKMFNAIGPAALASSLALAIAGVESSPGRRVLDAVSALGLAGVLAATSLATVPISRKLETSHPVDYPVDDAEPLSKTFSRAHAIRTTLGITAFVCAAAASLMPKKQ